MGCNFLVSTQPCISSILSIPDTSTQIAPTLGYNEERLRTQNISTRRIYEHTDLKLPSKLVAPEYGTIGILYLFAIFTTLTTSSVDFGNTTTLGEVPTSSL